MMCISPVFIPTYCGRRRKSENMPRSRSTNRSRRLHVWQTDGCVYGSPSACSTGSIDCRGTGGRRRDRNTSAPLGVYGAQTYACCTLHTVAVSDDGLGSHQHQVDTSGTLGARASMFECNPGGNGMRGGCCPHGTQRAVGPKSAKHIEHFGDVDSS